jgi:tetrahydromethanopterin S-methyltransferase subunit B
MSATDRTLLKPPQRESNDPALRLDDASDRVVVLAGNIIDQIHADVDELDQEDIDDLRTAIDDLEDVLDDVDQEGDQ